MTVNMFIDCISLIANFMEFNVQPKIGFKKTCKISTTEVINLRKGLKQLSFIF